jgi:hypothetical protein
MVVSFSLFFYSCSDNPSSIGGGLLKGDRLNVSEIDSFKDTLAQTSSYFKRTFELGGAGGLLVGKAENVESSTLMNFYISLEDSIKSSLLADSIEVIGARIYLRRIYSFGNKNGSYDITVHQIESGWTSAHFTADSLPMLSYDPSDISFNKTFSDTLDQFDINNDLALSWLKYSADSVGNNFGIYIKPSPGSQKIVGYQALYSGILNVPSITIAFQRLGVAYTDTLTFIANSDVSVVTGNIPSVTQSSIIVQGGLAINAKLWFDVSRVPFNAVINSAILTLHFDSAKTIISDTTNTILAGFLQDSSSLVADSSVLVTLNSVDNSLTGSITTYVQRWVNTGTNEGILLFARNEYSSVDLFTFMGSNAVDSLKPRLHIIYTTKKN